MVVKVVFYFITTAVVLQHEVQGTGELTRDEKKTMLDAHNYYRNYLPLTDRTGKTFSSTRYAVDMKLMLWDKELEQTAKDIAAKCIKHHDMVENNHTWAVRMAKQNYYIGQNLYGKSKWNSIHNVSNAVDKWYKEVRFYNWDDFTCDTEGDEAFMCTHMTEMMWDYTEFVGCAREKCMTKKGNKWTNMVCHYSPMGNVYGEAPFKVSDKREKCSDPERELNCQYGNLCSHRKGAKDREIECGEDNHNNDYLTNVLKNNDCDQKSSNFYKAFEYTPAACGLCLRNKPFECKNLQPDTERCIDEVAADNCQSNKVKYVDCPTNCLSCMKYLEVEAANSGRSQRDFNVTLSTLVYNDKGIYPGNLDERNQCPSQKEPIDVEGVIGAATEASELSGVIDSVFPVFDNDVFIQTETGDDKEQSLSMKLISNDIMMCVVMTLVNLGIMS